MRRRGIGEGSISSGAVWRAVKTEDNVVSQNRIATAENTTFKPLDSPFALSKTFFSF